MKNETINANEVLATIDTTIAELKIGLNPELLSEADKIELTEDIDDIIRLALKVKLQYQQRKIERMIKSLDEDKTVDVMKIKATSLALENVLKNSDKAA